MSQRSLETLLRPKSIAVIGASVKDSRASYRLMRNLLAGSFSGAVLPVTPAWKAVCGILAWPTIESLPVIPDLAIICTHHQRHPELLQQLGEKGCKACIILSAPESQFAQLQSLATKWRIRLMGPNSLGFLSPWYELNASFSPVAGLKGNLAFVSQSVAVSNTILDWAQQRRIGFSWFIALGDSLDVDIDDALDFLARDSKTSAILLYLENINDARRFVSASRSASRNKPVLVIKSGRSIQAQQFLKNHTGRDATWDAVIQRAGMLRVNDTHELFSAVETLSHMRPLRGERLMIISNGAAPAALALDTLAARNGKLARLSSETCKALQEQLSDDIQIDNPLDLKDSASTNHYLQAALILLNSNDIDALMIIHTPSALSPATLTAQKLIELIKQHARASYINLLTNWCGEHSSTEARRLFSDAKIPTYRTPEGAVTAFMHMVEYRRNQKQLRETPALPTNLPQDTRRAHELIHDALLEGAFTLGTHEVHEILLAYGLKVLPTRMATDSAEAVTLAEHIGYPVALKLHSPDISHKSELQGVMLYLNSASDVSHAAEAIFERVSQAKPQAMVKGLLVQPMASRADALELRIAMEQDPIFGPILLLGEADIELHQDNRLVVALPPLNMTLARYMIIQAIKRGYIRSHSRYIPLNIEELSQVLVRISNLIVDCPEIQSLNIHSLLAGESEFTILDIELTLSSFTGENQARLAIRPYPAELEEQATLNNNSTCLFRPILPEDEPLLQQFIAQVTREDLYYRYLSEITEFTHESLANMTQIDYDREMAIVAVRHDSEGKESEIIGVSRAISDADNINAEFSVLVRSDLKGLGLGKLLLEKIINYTKCRGLHQLNGITLPDNHRMIALAKKSGFTTRFQPEEGVVNLSLNFDSIIGEGKNDASGTS